MSQSETAPPKDYFQFFLSDDSDRITNYPNELINNHDRLSRVHIMSQLLDSVPDFICEKTNLKKHLNILNLQRNIIQTISPKISYLSNLTHLFLSGNRISQLPDSFQNLKNIKYLALNNNLFTEFPNVICSITSLSYLTMDQNEIQNWPTNIHLLQNLEYLSLIQNKITTLPSSLSHLNNLTTFKISHNQLKKISPNLVFSKLEVLFASNNLLKTLPICLLCGSSLIYVDVSYNKIKCLPVILHRDVILRLNGNEILFKNDFNRDSEIGKLVSFSNVPKLETLCKELVGSDDKNLYCETCNKKIKIARFGLWKLEKFQFFPYWASSDFCSFDCFDRKTKLLEEPFQFLSFDSLLRLQESSLDQSFSFPHFVKLISSSNLDLDYLDLYIMDSFTKHQQVTSSELKLFAECQKLKEFLKDHLSDLSKLDSIKSFWICLIILSDPKHKSEEWEFWIDKGIVGRIIAEKNVDLFFRACCFFVSPENCLMIVNQCMRYLIRIDKNKQNWNVNYFCFIKILTIYQDNFTNYTGFDLESYDTLLSDIPKGFECRMPFATYDVLYKRVQISNILPMNEHFIDGLIEFLENHLDKEFMMDKWPQFVFWVDLLFANDLENQVLSKKILHNRIVCFALMDFYDSLSLFTPKDDEKEDYLRSFNLLSNFVENDLFCVKQQAIAIAINQLPDLIVHPLVENQLPLYLPSSLMATNFFINNDFVNELADTISDLIFFDSDPCSTNALSIILI